MATEQELQDKHRRLVDDASRAAKRAFEAKAAGDTDKWMALSKEAETLWAQATEMSKQAFGPS